MPADTKVPEGFSLKRWSRRKLEAAREPAADGGPPVAPVAAPDAGVPLAAVPAVPPVPAAPIEAPLPAVESLTIDSDFTPFLQPNVDAALKRQALKKLFADPRFNVMDGLDVYIDDYTKSDPIPPDILERLMKHFDFMTPPVAGESPSDSANAPATPALAAETPPPTIEPPAVELRDGSASHSDGDARDPRDLPPAR